MDRWLLFGGGSREKQQQSSAASDDSESAAYCSDPDVITAAVPIQRSRAAASSSVQLGVCGRSAMSTVVVSRLYVTDRHSLPYDVQLKHTGEVPCRPIQCRPVDSARLVNYPASQPVSQWKFAVFATRRCCKTLHYAA